jgi:hypothetical protein
LDIFNGACITGSVGEAGLTREETFVVAGGRTPLARRAGVGLDIGEGGAAEEFVFDVGIGFEGCDGG